MMMRQDDDGAGRMMGQDDFNDGAGRSVNHIFSIHIMQCKIQFITRKWAYLCLMLVWDHYTVCIGIKSRIL